MTIADQIKEDTTFHYVKCLWEDGQKEDYIAKVFKLPLQKVEEIIQKIKGFYKRL
jgi:hypothetical protein